MLDGTSIDIISRFKEAVLSRSLQIPEHLDSPRLKSNRGNKLEREREGLRSRVVEYEGKYHLVFADSGLLRVTLRNKRKWKEFYEPDRHSGSSLEAIARLLESDEDEEDSDESDDNDTATVGAESRANGNGTVGGAKLGNGVGDSKDSNESPLAAIKLSELLAPIEHPSEIISHPAISRTFKLTVFHRLSMDLIELIEVEQDTLNWLNKLLQVLNGEDWYYLLEENLGLKSYDHGLDDDRKNRIYDEGSNDKNGSVAVSTGATTSNGDNSEINSQKSGLKSELETASSSVAPSTADGFDVTDPFFALPETLKKYEAHQLGIIPESDAQGENSEELLALQEDLINYLQVSIQRQHEYVKNLIELRKGLVRADRLRHDLYKWGKEMYEKKST